MKPKIGGELLQVVEFNILIMCCFYFAGLSDSALLSIGKVLESCPDLLSVYC